VRGRVALSEPAIAQRLQRDYVPVALTHERLLAGPFRDSWLRIVREANPRWQGGSTQGYYILSSRGAGLAWDNHPPRLAHYLALGLQFARNGRGGFTPSQALEYTAPVAPPAGAAVIKLFTRIRPLPAGAGEWNTLLGRDFMWITAEEIRELRQRSASGGEFPLPRTLVTRLLVYHLVDNVRGQVWAYQTGALRGPGLTGRVTRSTGANRTLAVSGSFSKRDSHPPQWTDRGHEGTVAGEIEIDIARDRVARFRLFADCRAWSDAVYDPRRPPSGRYPIQTAAIEATDALSRRIPPEPALAGPHYLRPELPPGILPP
jgi:hypothetical protein